MRSLALPVEILLCLEPTDLRCGVDRLSQQAAEHARWNVRHGGLYVFFNRRRDRLKLPNRSPDRRPPAIGAHADFGGHFASTIRSRDPDDHRVISSSTRGRPPPTFLPQILGNPTLGLPAPL
jgi:hypothetical protein